MATKKSNIEKFPMICRSCKVNPAEKSPRGIYCEKCRLEMAAGIRKSALKF
jgi:hypothetical protein